MGMGENKKIQARFGQRENSLYSLLYRKNQKRKEEPPEVARFIQVASASNPIAWRRFYNSLVFLKLIFFFHLGTTFIFLTSVERVNVSEGITDLLGGRA